MTESGDLIRELSEQTRWLRLLGIQTLRPLLQQVLVTEKQKLVYEASNGARSTREVGKVAGVHHRTVGDLWRDWAALGIVAGVEGHAGRYQQLVSLSTLGYELPTQVSASTKPSKSKPQDIQPEE